MRREYFQALYLIRNHLFKYNRLLKLQDAHRGGKTPNSIFIWIPKTAGTSLFRALSENGCRKFKSIEHIKRVFHPSGLVTFAHLSLANLVDEGYVPLDYYNNSFRFTFVRHPEARMISLYRYLQKKNVIPLSVSLEELIDQLEPAMQEPTPDPREFLSRIQAASLAWNGDDLYPYKQRCPAPGLYNTLAYSQCRPQMAFLKPPLLVSSTQSDHKVANFIGRMENLQEDMDTLMDRLDLPRASLPHLNATTADPIRVSKEVRNLIQRLYACDYEQFHYE
jgi:hypothetical protein